MKKILVLLAAAMLIVACGGSGKKAQTVEEKAADYTMKMLNAQTEAEAEAIEEEAMAWFETLSEEDQIKAFKAIEKARDEFYSSDKGDGEYEYDEYDYDEYDYDDYEDYDYEDYDEYDYDDYDDYDYDDYDDYDYGEDW